MATDRDPPVDRSPALLQRADDLIALFNGEKDPDRLFAPAFLAQVPPAKVREITAQLTRRLGPAKGIKFPAPPGGNSANLLFVFERGVAAVTLVIEPVATRRITGLQITGIDDGHAATLKTLVEVASAIETLPGRTSFTVANIGPRRFDGFAAHEAERALAIASTFKLIVLAELVRSIDAGERKWDDKLTLDGSELPAGRFSGERKGTEVPLRTLAEAMIKISDNSATDLLLIALGREQVEAMQLRLGVHDPAANQPFLTTLEAFKLKGVEQGALARHYLTRDEAGRRNFLTEQVAKVPGQDLHFRPGALIDRIEWFASAADLVRVMTWFRDLKDTLSGAEALRILALNPGIAPAVAHRFAYAGYKGGSEPGVISMTLLLQGKTQNWHVVTASWNNENGVDDLTFASLVERAVGLLADEK